MINDIENIMLACMLKRHPKTRRMHKYTLISETVFKPKQKRIAKRYSIQKYHVELIPDANGKRKKKRVKDDAVTGGLSALMKYMADELKGYGG